MGSRRALPLVLAVAGLVALAALAAHGRPLRTSHGSGPSAGFFDYVFTSIALVFVAILILFLYSLFGVDWHRPPQRPARFNLVQWLTMVAACLLLGELLLHSHFRFRAKSKTETVTTVKGETVTLPSPSPIGRRNARIRWDEVAIVGALLAAAGVAIFATRKKKPLKEWRFAPHEEVAVALDESLDDLRSEPDVRRAIIAAYARMERALAAVDLARRPSEAPFEYLSRALQSLDASAPAVTRLTDLFERAKFSHHEPDESMREDAIDALVAVRDELRAPLGVPA